MHVLAFKIAMVKLSLEIKGCQLTGGTKTTAEIVPKTERVCSERSSQNKEFDSNAQKQK